MKTVGIIGGLGPGTTAEFYLAIVSGFARRNVDRTPPIIIGSVSATHDVYQDCILKNDCRFLPYLLKEAKRLEESGADFLVMPCNTLHRYMPEIKAAVKIPVLSIVEETLRYIKEHGFNKVGLIATMGTVKNKVYEDLLSQNDIELLKPSDLAQQQLNKIIVKLVDGMFLDSDRQVIMSTIDDMAKRNADAVALACTDLQLLLPESEEVHVFDTMRILAEAVVEYQLEGLS